MIDIHTHILPAIDDGAKNTEETLQMLKEAEKAGFTDIFATSHYISGHYEFNKIDREYIIKAVMEKAEQKNINVKIHIGAEAYISINLPELIEKNTIPTLGNSRYILFELPMNSKVMNTEHVIDRIGELGLIPVIAHPERYEVVMQDPNIVLKWIEKGALLQANYGSIINAYGSKSKDILIKLLNANAIHFLGTDTHYAGSFYTKMEEIKQALVKEISQEKFNILSYENPKKILQNEIIEAEEPKKIKIRLFR